MICIGLLSSCTTTSTGEFYSLQKAYDEGFLTQEDLKSIAYYLNGEKADEDGFTAAPKKPKTLGNKAETAIKEGYAALIRLRADADGTLIYPDTTIDDVTISRYYGTYKNCIAVRLTDCYSQYPAVIREITVGGVAFTYTLPGILIWVIT